MQPGNPGPAVERQFAVRQEFIQEFIALQLELPAWLLLVLLEYKAKILDVCY